MFHLAVNSMSNPGVAYIRCATRGLPIFDVQPVGCLFDVQPLSCTLFC